MKWFDKLRGLFRRKKITDKNDGEKTPLAPVTQCSITQRCTTSHDVAQGIDEAETNEVLARLNEDDNRGKRALRNFEIAQKNRKRQQATLGYGLKSRNFRPRPAYEKRLWDLNAKPSDDN